MSGARPKRYAHSLAGRPAEEWHDLEEHLRRTAELAETFTASYAPGYGRLAGWWHDAGKYRRLFQAHIGADLDLHVTDRIDHSSIGALIAKERGCPMLSFVIAGHHGGMQNGDDLRSRLVNKAELLTEARWDGLPRFIEDQPHPEVPLWLQFTQRASLSLWTRMIFSALVDADFLDTERFYASGRDRYSEPRIGLADLKSRLDRYLTAKMATVESTVVNKMRMRVLRACRDNTGGRGVYTLTVPTGGGKTFAALAFALGHALRHNLRRVIVVIPYTSIIEQTAKAYRTALGDDTVVEHHSNIDPDKETHLNRLASENWDAPVVVTTSVQFFESLFANRPSRCRKLHRIAQSIVVFDEVQMFPPKLLEAVRYVMRELADHYGSTLLLCTATQPVLLKGAEEIIPDPAAEFATVARRCDVRLPTKEEAVPWQALARELQSHSQVLAIVHRRDDAQQLTELMGDDCLHLSARMCAVHRSSVLAEVKARLGRGAPCRLVATQLIEAGVDVDFPHVYRAFAGADSLAQAAGRCNREGLAAGTLHVFIPPTQPPRGILRTAEGVARAMWRDGALRLNEPSTFRDYFARLYQFVDQDGHGVMNAEGEQRFADAAELFKMIEESGQPVVAPYGDWQPRLEAVRLRMSREGMRRLQPFMVSLYRQEIEILLRSRALERIADSFWAIAPGFRVYSSRWGFGWQGPIAAEPEDLIA